MRRETRSFLSHRKRIDRLIFGFDHRDDESRERTKNFAKEQNIDDQRAGEKRITCRSVLSGTRDFSFSLFVVVVVDVRSLLDEENFIGEEDERRFRSSM